MTWRKTASQMVPYLQRLSFCSSNLDDQIVEEAVTRVGSSRKSTSKALFDALTEYNDKDFQEKVERYVQALRRCSSSNYEDEEECISEEEEIEYTVEEAPTPTPTVTCSREEVREKFLVSLSNLPLLRNVIEGRPLEMEEKIWSFCSQFPEDYEFDKDTLLQLWIARGFLEGDHMDPMAHSYFDILLSNGYILHTGMRFPEEIHTYRLNVNGFGNSVDNTMQRELQERLKSFYCDDFDGESPRTSTSFEDLKALLLSRKDASRINKIPSGVFLALKHLEVLDLSRTYIMELPNSIANLVELRYLDVSDTPIELLPETIDGLSNLKTLKLNNCDFLLRLPNELRMLTSLEHLELDVLGNLSFMPKGMGALTNLKTLYAFLVDRVDGRNINELQGLNNLQGRFCVSRLENVLSPQEAKEAALHNKQFLKELDLRWTELKEGRNVDVEILEELRPSFELAKLCISSYAGSKFPSWISDSRNMLTSITLFKCVNCYKLPALGQLPHLEILTLVELNAVTEIGEEFRGKPSTCSAFPKLKSLEVIGFDELSTWKGAKEADYPHLRKLVIEGCPELRGIPSTVVCRNTIERLEIIKCSKLTSFIDRGLSNSLKTLIIQNCPSMVRRLQMRREDRNKIRHVQNVWIDQQEIKVR